MAFDAITEIQLAVQFGGAIKSAIDVANSNADIIDKIKQLGPYVAPILEHIGASLFPNAKKELHIAAGAMAAFDPNVTKWVQGALNNVVTPSPALDVDGIYGPKTKAAVEKFQADNKLTSDGWAGTITRNAIDAILTAKLNLPTGTGPKTAGAAA
jgi:peptidoglycan hydrolase-like protein with peptidoglycan-binding domain